MDASTLIDTCSPFQAINRLARADYRAKAVAKLVAAKQIKKAEVTAKGFGGLHGCCLLRLIPEGLQPLRVRVDLLVLAARSLSHRLARSRG